MSETFVEILLWHQIELSGGTPGWWSRIGFHNSIHYIWEGKIGKFVRILGKGIEGFSHRRHHDLKDEDRTTERMTELV
jgi:hypothetical protein